MKTVEISPEVRAILEQCVCGGNALALPDIQLDRKLYEAVDKVLRALGGKWNRGRQAHLFPSSVEPLLAEALGNGHAVDIKRTYEQFFTPPEVAELVADLAEISATHHVLEPSAGDGRLVRAALRRGCCLTGVEIDEKLSKALAEALIAEGLMHGVGIFRADFLEWAPPGFLAARSENPLCGFDRVVMNPPFGNRADIAHVRRAFGFLRPGGKLVAIMSPHWTFAATVAAREFAQFVRSLDGDWEPLPEGTFKKEGTGVNAGILVLDKPE